MATAFNEVVQGQRLWQPSPEHIQPTRLTHYLAWLKRERGLSFVDYHGLWQWSVDDLDAFWQSIWDHFRVQASSQYLSLIHI